MATTPWPRRDADLAGVGAAFCSACSAASRRMPTFSALRPDCRCIPVDTSSASLPCARALATLQRSDADSPGERDLDREHLPGARCCSAAEPFSPMPKDSGPATAHSASRLVPNSAHCVASGPWARGGAGLPGEHDLDRARRGEAACWSVAQPSEPVSRRRPRHSSALPGPATTHAPSWTKPALIH